MKEYVLPEGDVQIAFSGGRTSAYMLHKIMEANGGLPDRAVVTFQNTGREMPETLDFVAEVGDRWNVPIVWLEYRPKKPLEAWQYDAVVQAFGPDYAGKLRAWWQPDERGFAEVSHNSAARDGEPFVALVIARRFLPNVMARFCTIEMKVRVAKKYLRSLGWERWTNAVGLRADEPHRLNKPPPKDRWTVWTPLADANVSRHDVALFWRRQPFDLRLLNVRGSAPLGNCDGCFLKSEANIAAFAKDHPERAAWWERMEALAASLTSGTAGTFSKRYTREELRRNVETQGSWAFDAVGYFCQADDGDCTG